MNLYKIDGGIGKNIAFTAIIQELAERDGGEICIETAYPEVYINIPGVARIYNSNEPKDMKKFYSCFDNVFAHDPYVGNMWKGNVHVIDAWAQMFGLKSKTRFPVVKVTASDADKEVIDEKLGDKPFIVLQISGGQSPYEIRDINNLPAYESNPMRAGRNVVAMDDLYNELKAKFPEHNIVQFALPNEPQIKDAIQLQMHYINWFYVFDKADFFVGIDSMMQHYMASIKKPGMVFWDMNEPTQYGYEYHGISHYNTSLPGGVHISKAVAINSVRDIAKHLASITKE